eukprot:1159077-Pelagomonas_calceolata.AAC.10
MGVERNYSFRKSFSIVHMWLLQKDPYLSPVEPRNDILQRLVEVCGTADESVRSSHDTEFCFTNR